MLIAKVQDKTTKTGAKDTGLAKTGGRFWSKIDEEDAKRDVNSSTADAAGCGNSSSKEPNKGANNVVPEIMVVLVMIIGVVRRTAPIEKLAAEALVVASVYITEYERAARGPKVQLRGGSRRSKRI